jgi:glycosyltransferase involved in cell wall biosynthesis
MNVANGYWIPLLRLRGIPTVVNVDGIEWQREKWSPLGRRVFKIGASLTAKFADELIFDAKAIASHWQQEFGRTGTYIPYGGDQVAPDDRTPEFEPGKYVLLVARFVPENSVELLLAAAPDIVTKYNVDVVLVGSAPPGDYLQVTAEALAASNSRIHLLGHISDDARLHSLWRHAGVYFHGHSVGGTNPALVQAMALGARVAARDTIYNREVLAESGAFFEPSPTSVVEVVGEVLNSGQDLGSMAAHRAHRCYDWETVCSTYEKALVETMANKGNLRG